MTAVRPDRPPMRDVVLDALLEQVPVVVFATDLDGVCTYLEGAGLPALRLAPGSLVGVDLNQAFSDRTRELASLRTALSGRQVSFTWRTSRLALDTWLSPLYDAGGAVIGAMGVTLDVSEQVRETERRLSQQRGLLLHLHEAQETERRRIAADVHDDTVQAVAAVGLRLQSARRNLSVEGRADVAAMLDDAAESVREAGRRLRRLLYDLDVPDRLDQDLPAALREYAAVVCQDEPFTCTVEGTLGERPPLHASRVLFRIAQEAMANARSHAKPTRVEVRLAERDHGFLLTVQDDGAGLPAHLAVSARQRSASPAGHLGLRSMAERAESIGGWCAVRGLDGGGTLVEAWVPARVDLASGASRSSAGSGPTGRTLLEQTVESISEGFAALDRDWRYVYMNQVGADMLRRHDLVGRVCWGETPIAPEVETALRDAVRLQRPQVARAFYADLGRWVESRVFPSPDGLSIFFRDVSTEQESERRAAERLHIIAGAQALVAAMAGQAELEPALRGVLPTILDTWRLHHVRVVVDGPGLDPLDLSLGEQEPDDQVREVPIELFGGRVGALCVAAPSLDDPMRGLPELLGLRITAARSGT